MTRKEQVRTVLVIKAKVVRWTLANTDTVLREVELSPLRRTLRYRQKSGMTKTSLPHWIVSALKYTSSICFERPLYMYQYMLSWVYLSSKLHRVWHEEGTTEVVEYTYHPTQVVKSQTLNFCNYGIWWGVSVFERASMKDPIIAAEIWPFLSPHTKPFKFALPAQNKRDLYEESRSVKCPYLSLELH